MRASLLGAAKRFIGKRIVPQGQIQWITPGTYQWTVPPGVYHVSGVIIGGGDYANSTKTGGNGGGLRYRNNYAVTPGQVLTIVVGRGTNASERTTSALGMTVGSGIVGTPFSAEVLGGYGAVEGNPYQNQGGPAGTYDNGVNPPWRETATGFKGGRGSSLLGSAAVRSTSSNGGGAACGGGGAWGGNNGGPGGARIIWGEGRAYPNTKVLDQPVIA
jgi:hypothetical protein